MRSGSLRHRITLQKKVSIADSFGELIDTWVDIATVWAEKVNLNGSELYAAKQFMANVSVIFRIRWRAHVSPVDIVICDGRTYDIGAVIEIGWRQGYELYASARAE